MVDVDDGTTITNDGEMARNGSFFLTTFPHHDYASWNAKKNCFHIVWMEKINGFRSFIISVLLPNGFSLSAWKNAAWLSIKQHKLETTNPQ